MLLIGYIVLFFAVVAASTLLYLPVFFRLRKQGQGFIKSWRYLLFFFSLFLIVFATIVLFQLPISFNPERRILNLQPLKWIWEEHIQQRLRTEIRPNILLFIPLGFFTPMAFLRMRTWYMTAFVAFIVTFNVEFFQYFIGRSSDIDDLIANVLGGIMGYGIFKIANFLFKKQV